MYATSSASVFTGTDSTPGDHQRADRNAHDRIEILDRIVERLGLQQRLVDVRQRATEQERVAIRPRARGSRRASNVATAADVLNHRSADAA